MVAFINALGCLVIGNDTSPRTMVEDTNANALLQNTIAASFIMEQFKNHKIYQNKEQSSKLRSNPMVTIYLCIYIYLYMKKIVKGYHRPLLVKKLYDNITRTPPCTNNAKPIRNYSWSGIQLNLIPLC